MWDLLRSPTKGFVECKQAELKQHHDHHSNLWCLFPGSKVQVRIYHGDTKWISGIIFKKLWPVTYSVDIGDGRTVKRHIDQLLQSIHQSPQSTSNAIDDYCYYEPVTPVQEVDPVPLIPPPRLLKEEQGYPRRQHCPPARFIHESC